MPAWVPCLGSFKQTHLISQPLNGDAPEPGALVRGTKIAAYWPDGTEGWVDPKKDLVGVFLIQRGAGGSSEESDSFKILAASSIVN